MIETSDDPRELREDERAIIRAMLPDDASDALRASMDDAGVIELQNGAMGNIRFLRSTERRRATRVAQAEYEDADGVLVSIELSADQSGDLFELDFWKVEFSRLKRFPSPRELRIVR